MAGLPGLFRKPRRVGRLAEWTPDLPDERVDLAALRAELLAPAHPGLRAYLQTTVSEGVAWDEWQGRVRLLQVARLAAADDTEGFLVQTMERWPLAVCRGCVEGGEWLWLVQALSEAAGMAVQVLRERDGARFLGMLSQAERERALLQAGAVWHPRNARVLRLLLFDMPLVEELCLEVGAAPSAAGTAALSQLFRHLAALVGAPIGALEALSRLTDIARFDRASIPVLHAYDVEAARRTAIRDRIFGEAGPALEPVLDVLLSAELGTPPIVGGPRAAASHPTVAHLLGHSPTVLGQALVFLGRLLGRREALGIADWSDLRQREGGYLPSAAAGGSIPQGIRIVMETLCRRTLVLDGNDLAWLISALPGLPGLQNRGFLKLALSAAAAEPVVVEALQAIAAESQGALSAEWRAEIDTKLGGTGRLPLPELDFSSHQAADKLSAHFGSPFDARLHAAEQRAYLAELTGAVEALIAARQQVDPAPLYALARAPGVGADERAVALGRAMLHDPSYWAQASDGVVRRGAEISAVIDAVGPFVARHPATAARLHAQAVALAKKSTPSATWRKGSAAIGGVGAGEWVALLAAYLDAARAHRSSASADDDSLRTLILMAAGWEPGEVGPLLTEFARQHCYQSDPGTGIRDEKLGNACLWALIHMPDGAGVPFLARLLARVKYPKIRAKIDAALNEAAEAAGVSRGALDELSIPTHELDAAGRHRMMAGGAGADLVLDGSASVVVQWRGADGSPLKGPTAAMKKDPAGLKAVKAAVKEIEEDLATQVIRMQRLYLDDRSWPAAEWRERYLEHPLLRPFTVRLLWWVERAGVRQAALAWGGQLQNVAGDPLETEGAVLRLWHPIEDEMTHIAAWRDRIEALGLVQPFAQVWRETYRLTDAERATGDYSNRWAGHILKQHQAMTLARLNRWTVTHRMWVDASNDEPWHIALPAHGLVADYWVEGAGDPHAPEVLASGAYTYVSTDRLRFQRAAGADSAHGPRRSESVALEVVPAVVVSEVMRHCDLLTAVGSIASDPEWRDRGAQAVHPSQWQLDAALYWERASFAALSGSGRVRRELLERLVPRLGFADRCSFDETSLLVQGTRHLYRIHLGSAAVQIAATRRHVCIVPARVPGVVVRLPFAGDTTLSMILSKAALLVRDDQITDPVILLQI